MDCYQDLANAIVTQAAKDYEYALKHRSHECYIDELERFFKSDYYRILTKFDGERLMNMIKEECENGNKPRTKHERAN